MKPLKDAKSTVRGLGAEDLEELDAPVSEPTPASRAVKAVAPRSAGPGSYQHVPPKRNTREMTATNPDDKLEKGGTLRPPSPSNPDIES